MSPGAGASSVSTAPSVPLPHRRLSDVVVGNKPPVWSINHSVGNADMPLPAKCSRHERGEVCCKELKDDDERTLVDPDVVRDVVIGLSDGLTVPFALTAGLSSLGESRLVILGGVAELIAGAISMGIGGFLASQAERDHYRYLRKHTAARVLRSCDGEMEREVHGVLGPVGVDEKTSRMVAHNLRNVEIASEGEGDRAGSGLGPDAEAGLRWSASVGLTAFLLKFGEGLEEIPSRRMYISAFTIGMGYLIGGLIPLLPYFFEPVAHIALIWSCLVTGAVLLIFGAVKARITGAAGRGVGGYVWGAVSTLLVGGTAAAAAYGLVRLFEASDT
ncbi:membrane fraction protein [Obba rivulosa]|uniref:Membrane fraction protein n=1 Tax=Obba rivulosa TaxID=1052685 RepID=A0A8E2DJJ4_9APHY|nr:membrane fraction protein [Obba rivulosa]